MKKNTILFINLLLYWTQTLPHNLIPHKLNHHNYKLTTNPGNVPIIPFRALITRGLPRPGLNAPHNATSDAYLSSKQGTHPYI